MKKMRWFPLYVMLAVFLSYILLEGKLKNDRRDEMNIVDQLSPENSVMVEAFLTNNEDATEDYSEAIQKAIDYTAAHQKEKVLFKANKKYRIKSGIILKEGVKMEFGQNSILEVAGNMRVITLEKDAVIENGTIEVTDPFFRSEVIFLEGNDRFDATNKTHVENVTIINKSGSHKGTGLSLYAKGTWHNISFVNFENVTIIGFKTGVQLKAQNPNNGTYSWINANRFENLTLEDCVLFISIIGSRSIPNECSGNFFSGMQVQLTEKTEQFLKIDGSHNKFESMIWDIQRVQSNKPLIEFSSKTEKNILDINLNEQYIRDGGQLNEY